MADSKEKLFSEFPPVTTQEWMDKITEDLKGADFEKKLVWKTNEGFKVRPFYRTEDLEGMKTTDSLPGEFPFVRGTKIDNNWYVSQEIEVTNPKEANAKALDILEKGVDSLCFSFSGKDFTAKEMETLLKGIQLECIEINFKTCYKEAAKITQMLVDYAKAKNLNLGEIKGSANFDPFKGMMVNGTDINIDFDIITGIKDVVKAASELPHFRIFGANPYLFNKAGAYCVQELGFALAYGNEYLTLGTAAGIAPEDVASKIKFNFGISSNYFMEIAKFRAARLLWAQIVNAYLPEGACKKAAKMNVHATTTEWNQTIYDGYMNLLRSETEAMSASIAGVDSITVTPFDQPYKTPDDFSERIARNQQLLLKEEAHFDKVVDVASGSFYVENLTASLAEEAWKLFLAIDEKGGFYKALKEGFIQDEVNASDTKRQTAIASRREILVGTNQYPNFNESSIEKVKEGNKYKECCCDSEKGTIPTLHFKHGSSAFDALRLSTEESGKRPKVFMLTIGKLSMRLARAQFSSNFFACAGYEIIDNLGFNTPEEGVAAARKAKADVIVLCSSDDEYAELAPVTSKAIGSGKEIFVVAGAPACMEDLKTLGINNFIHVRSNVLQTLQDFNKQLGIN
jgi:methylmalonyl-CoA mutase